MRYERYRNGGWFVIEILIPTLNSNRDVSRFKSEFRHGTRTIYKGEHTYDSFLQGGSNFFRFSEIVTWLVVSRRILWPGDNQFSERTYWRLRLETLKSDSPFRCLHFCTDFLIQSRELSSRAIARRKCWNLYSPRSLRPQEVANSKLPQLAKQIFKDWNLEGSFRKEGSK